MSSESCEGCGDDVTNGPVIYSCPKCWIIHRRIEPSVGLQGWFSKYAASISLEALGELCTHLASYTVTEAERERHRTAVGLFTDLDALTRRVREFLDEEVKR